MIKISKKTLTDLEFPTVREQLSEFCITDLGKQNAVKLKPFKSVEKTFFVLHQTQEYKASAFEDARIPNHGFDSVDAEIRLLEIENSLLELRSFWKIGQLSETANMHISFFRKYQELYPNLFKTTDMSLACIGRLSKADIERKVSGRFSDDCILVSDKHRSIAAFAKSEHLQHINFKASEHTAGGEYHVQNINNMAASLKSTINHTLRGVSTKYLQNYATWHQIMSKKISPEELSNRLLKNKNTTQSFVNREGIYKWFIENLSKRTYRCPVKKSYLSAVNQETLAKLSLL